MFFARRVDGVKVKKDLMGSQIWAMVVTLARLASTASMVASMASMVLMAPRATTVLASVALKAPMAGVSALRCRKLRIKLVRRWSYNSGMITVVYELGQNTPKTRLCSSTKLAVEDDGPICSRRVDDVKVKKEPMGCQLWALVVTMARVATMASMASMVWMAQGGTDVEVPLVASNGGDEWWARMCGVDGWRRWVASMGGVDGWRRWVTSMVDWGLRDRGH